MAVKTAQYIFNGQAYNLTYNSTSGKWEATVTAPSKSSYNQPDHVLGGTVKATDAAGNTTTVDQSHATLGASLKLRVKEKTAPTITITSPSAGAYITNTTPTIEFQVKDTDSGVNAGTIAITVDGTAVSTVTKTAIDGGYKCTCTSPTLKDGSHTISVKASDNDGNAAAAKTAIFTVDTVPPTLQITAPSNDLITNKKTVTVSGKTDDVSSKPVIDEMLLYASTSIGWKSPVTFLVACVVAMWLICNEIISILENIQDMGVNIPAFMQPLVKHIRSQVEDQVKVDNDSEGE